MRYLLSLCFLGIFLYAQELETAIEEVNILQKEESGNSIDYNRVRAEFTIGFESYENLFAKLIIDNENIYDISEDKNRNETAIYRGYIRYMDGKNLLGIGKQRIPFGVGRIWNPTDIFNPIDITTIEPDNREGTESVRYEYAISTLSNLDATVSKDKYALRVKGFLSFADMALMALKDNKSDTRILGYEYSGELFETGVELRSEGAYRFQKNGKDHLDLIAGAEYSFENSLTLLGEYRHNSLSHSDYLGSTISYEITPLLTGSFLVLKNFEDKSRFYSIGFDYSLADDITLDIGKLIYHGENSSEYGSFNDTYFMKFFIHF